MTAATIKVEKQFLGRPASQFQVISHNAMSYYGASNVSFISITDGREIAGGWYRVGDRVLMLAEPMPILTDFYTPLRIRYVNEKDETCLQGKVDFSEVVARVQKEKPEGRIPVAYYYQYLKPQLDPDGETVESTVKMIAGWRAEGIARASSLCETLFDRLPLAYEGYVRSLREQGRGGELTRSAEESMALWTGANDSTWTEIPRQRVWPGQISLPPLPSSEVLEGRLVSDTTRFHGEYDDCRDFYDLGFEHTGGKIWFTLGNGTEFCADDPFMIWEDQGHQRRDSFPDFQGHNIEELWCSGNYLVFGLSWYGEFGGEHAGLGFWNLATGEMSVLIAETRSGGDPESKTPLPDPERGLGVYLRDLEDAEIVKSDDAIVIRTPHAALEFWPKTKRWAKLLPAP